MPDADAAPRLPVRRALLSVYHKEGVVELARALVEGGAELLSTGGTLAALREAGLRAVEVAEWTGFPEMLDGRVKTLHPRIHGGLLGRRDLEEHRRQMAEHGIEPIDLVCVNLYPFEETLAAGAAPEEVLEKIDIGGPAMLRSAAKNHAHVAVVCDPADYGPVAESIRAGGTTQAERRRLAAKVFARTAAYDAAIAAWLQEQAGGGEVGAGGEWPEQLAVAGRRAAELRYGENPHQAGAFYADPAPTGLGAAEVLPGGKELSYNNLLDLDGALAAVGDLPAPAAVVVKHSNPCGAAVAGSAVAALERAWAGDPVSAFGSVVALNAPLDAAAAEFLCTGQKFVEVLAAPDFAPEAVERLRSGPKWGRSLRLVRVRDLAGGPLERRFELRRVAGGFLVMEPDRRTAFQEELRVAGKVPPPEGREQDLRLAQTLVKHLKSNAVCLVRDGMLVGAGAGQMSRVDSARIAVEKAGERARGAVAGSDAFFPFPDGVEVLAAAGVVAVVQPGGSRRDDEVTATADRLGVCMVHTGVRHFRH